MASCVKPVERVLKMWNVLWAFTFIATGGMLFGYIIGINSNIITDGQILCAERHVGAVGSWTSWGYRQCYQLNTLEIGFFSSLNLIGACISSLVCFRFADSIGRKLEVQIAGVLFLTGATIAGVSPVLWGTFLGFLVYGLGIGFAMHAAPVYIAEISPAEVRGALVSAKEAVIVLGMFLGFLSGYGFGACRPHGWRLMVLCSGVLALAMLCGVARIPQSPRFLVLQAVRQGIDVHSKGALPLEASSALQFFRQASAEEVRVELEALFADLKASFEEDGERQSLAGGTQQPGALDAFEYPRPLIVGCGLVLLQQVTGQPSVLYLATNIFKSAGFRSSAALQAVGMGLVKLVATLLTVWHVDSRGRRLFLFLGISMMAVALALVGTGFLFTECTTPVARMADCEKSHIVLPQGWAITTVIALMLYVSGYQVGFGPITWLMISEVFPLKVRGSAMSVAAMTNFGSNIALTLCTPLLMDVLTPAGLFFVFFFLTLVSLTFVAALVPETKGRTLEEINALMRSSAEPAKASGRGSSSQTAD